MSIKNRTQADRYKALQPRPPAAVFPLAMVREMRAGGGGRDFACTVSGYYRTQIFEFPGVDFRPDGQEHHHTLYASSPVYACVTSDLVNYFETSARSGHYAVSPSLRCAVGETVEKVGSQQRDGVPVFLVMEESNSLTPVAMVKGECGIWDETMTVDGDEVPRLDGGREGEQVIEAWHTVDGAWPDLPNNQLLVNLILAGVRAGQQTPDPIRRFVDKSCLVTDDGRFVVMMQPTVSARGSTATLMDPVAFGGRISEIGRAVAAMEQDIGRARMRLLVDSMYSDEYKDDSYQRLQYLRLWESLVKAANRLLRLRGSFGDGSVAVGGEKTPRELKDYRNAIAHWWTGTIDESFLADLRRTANELLRRRYF